MSDLQARIARIARTELGQRYATPELAAEAMSSAVINEIGLTQFWAVGEADGYQGEECFESAAEAEAAVRNRTHHGRGGSYVITAWHTGWGRVE